MLIKKNFGKFKDLSISWTVSKGKRNLSVAVVFIHGFGACKEHWRNNQNVIGEITDTYAIDLIGFGESCQPTSQLKNEIKNNNNYIYCFDNWSDQIEYFCKEIVNRPVILVGNSIGGVIALKAAEKLRNQCKGVIGINCAQRRMDDKRLSEQSTSMQLLRPLLKQIVSKRLISKNLFKALAKPSFIEKILRIAYPTNSNVNDELIEILYKATQRQNADESFRGFINLFDDYLAQEIMKKLLIPVHLIWGEQDPWEDVKEAQKWYSTFSCIRSLEIIPNAGHCPHDECPEKVNPILIKIIQQAT